MSQVISLDQADFVQPTIQYDEMAAVNNVIKSIKTLNHNIETLKKQYQTDYIAVDFSVNQPA
ncbi:hypothetical protein N7931_03415 [Catenovulum sp. 2E275]|uniref:hypothetical protein n=1 Tax=Catenovulum sp. 2E275 TaxID=2980497 RepID=UPI0021D39D23|nr:hypothetical protein [Catenovulum sp. 2E275]MCU4674674.1 hypothetical protein [Catenovulum sp. 2E275]